MVDSGSERKEAFREAFVPVKQQWKDRAVMDREKYEVLYRSSIENPTLFWEKEGRRLDWIKPYSQINVKDCSFGEDVHICWFKDGVLNVAANCIDRHLDKNADKTAIIWQGDRQDEYEYISYQKLYEKVCRFANGLKKRGVQKGDRVIIYMPMIPEAAYAMLACARIGAIHSVVFGGFSQHALKNRIEDCSASCVITADEGLRGGSPVPLKVNVDAAIDDLKDPNGISTVVVVRRTNASLTLKQGRDIDYKMLIEEAEEHCLVEPMNAEDPLFILYTSGSTGQPKGVLHTQGGYLVYASITQQYVFACSKNDVFWCTADIGWVTGHSYVVYGPLANGFTTLMFEGVPSYPTWSRFWEIIDQHKVSILYTAPTAIRAAIRQGESAVQKCSLHSLDVLATVGEPINPEVWRWYYEKVGKERCPIIDTWWQTETGGHLITPVCGISDLKAGSCGRPFLGIDAAIVDESGNELHGACEGYLCIKDSWPGQMRGVYGDRLKFVETYFTRFPGKYVSGDGARRDKDGYYWITGRVDDVLNVSGHRLGTAEIESALVAHQVVAEAAVVGFPHEIKGEGIYAFVILSVGTLPSAKLKQELIAFVRAEIGPIVTIDVIQFAKGVPKTRSGKIMRRILRKIAVNDVHDLGDTNTLTNPEVIETLLNDRQN